MTEAENAKKRLGDFEILRELGRGGMGVVYEARQLSLNRKVALKVISSGLGLSSKAALRFQREAEAAGRLHHTNIVPIYSTGNENGMYYYAMELIDGPSLYQVIQALRRGKMDGSKVTASAATAAVGAELIASTSAAPGGSSAPGREPPEWVSDLLHSPSLSGDTTPPPTSMSRGSSASLRSSGEHFDTLATMIAGVADALDYAHENGVIHRDIKPANLLLSKDGRLSINDFGLARILEQPGMTLSGEFVGSPLYMSPEQITAGRAPLDHRTDVYSLGATLYEILTLEPPFPGQSRDEVIAQIIHKEPVPPRRHNRKVPVDLETICLKALEKDPDRRYQTAGQFAEDLRRFVNRFAIGARRAGPMGRAMKWAKRRPGLAAALGCAILLALVAGFFARQAFQAEQRRVKDQRVAQGQLLAEKQRRATDLLLSGDLEAAEQAMDEAMSLGAPPGWAQLLHGQLAYHRGQFGQAMGHLEQAVKELPNNVSARGLLASSGVWAGRWEVHDRAIEGIEELGPITPEDWLYRGLAESYSDPVRGLETMDKAVLRRESAIARTLRAGVRADYAMETSDAAFVEKAIEDIRAAKAMAPDSPIAHSTGVFVYLIAAGFYEDAAQMERRHAALEEAERDCRALEEHRAAPYFLWSRATYFLVAGKDDEEFDLWRRNSEGTQSDLVNDSGYALALYRRGRVSQALDFANRRLPGTGFWQDAVWAYLQAEAPDGPARVLKAYDEILARRYVVGAGVFDSPATLLFAGHKAEAVNAWRAARQNPERLAKLNLAFILRSLDYLCGELSAEGLIQATGRSKRNQTVAHYFIGMMLLAEGDRAGARKHFQASVATRCFYYSHYEFSRTFLARMERDPDWPPWIPVKDSAGASRK